MLKRGTKRAFAMLLSLSMIFGGTNITAFAESSSNEAEDTQTVSVSSNDVVQISDVWDGVTTESVLKEMDFR